MEAGTQTDIADQSWWTVEQQPPERHVIQGREPMESVRNKRMCKNYIKI
jgi:hypothetical protein